MYMILCLSVVEIWHGGRIQLLLKGLPDSSVSSLIRSLNLVSIFPGVDIRQQDMRKILCIIVIKKIKLNAKGWLSTLCSRPYPQLILEESGR